MHIVEYARILLRSMYDIDGFLNNTWRTRLVAAGSGVTFCLGRTWMWERYNKEGTTSVVDLPRGGGHTPVGISQEVCRGGGQFIRLITNWCYEI